MNQIIELGITYFIELSIALGCVYAIYKAFKIKYHDARLSNRSFKGWETRKSKTVVSVKISVRKIPVTINGYEAGNIIIKKVIA